jgi:hypothetical protein
MYIKASAQHINPMTDKANDAFFYFRESLESRYKQQVITNQRLFVEAIQTRPLSEYFSLFAHLIFRYVYMKNDATYSILLSAFSNYATEDDKTALIRLRDEAMQRGGKMLEALQKLDEDQRRLAKESYTGSIPIYERDAQLTEQISLLKNPIIPILAGFCIVEKIVKLCAEMSILEAESPIRQELHDNPIQCLARMIPIFDLLQQGEVKKLREAIRLTLLFVAIPVSDELVNEIQDTLFQQGFIKKSPASEQLVCPEPSSELGQLISSILHPEEECDGEEPVPRLAASTEAPVSAPPGAASARLEGSPQGRRIEGSLRISLLRGNYKKMKINSSTGEEDSATPTYTVSF